MQITEIQPTDDGAFGEWFEVLDACLEVERPGEPHWTIEEQRPPALELVTAGTPFDGGLLVARRGDQVVGAARWRLPLREQQHTAEVLVLVHPRHRRHGVGRALLRELTSRVEGRTVLTTDIDEPAGRSSDGAAFAHAVGARLVLESTRRTLTLPTDPARAISPGPTGPYTVVTWQNHVPDALLLDRAFLEEQIDEDAPSGGLGGRSAYDGERFRALEQVWVDQGRVVLSAGAVDDGGRLVAFTDLAVPGDQPQTAYQWGTAVLPGHRGHRLGITVKRVALDLLAASGLRSERVLTWNAESNTHMVAVNEALGFVPDGRLSTWALHLP